MQKRWDILGIGTAAVDDLLTVERFPQPDEKLPILAQQRQGGGQTATALVAAARHGARTAFLARLGEDEELSGYTIRELEREGVDCSLIERAAGYCPVHAVIIVDGSNGRRTILYNARGMVEPERIEAEWIAASRVLFFDQNAPRIGLRAAQMARATGIPVIVDLEPKNTPALAEILAHVDHLIVGEAFAARFSNEQDPSAMVARLVKEIPAGAAGIPPVVVVTCGEQGCWYSEGGSRAVHVPALPVQAVDTTGCGDVFHGAYASAIARREPVARAVQIANATAGIKATQTGGRAGIPGLDAVENALRHEE